jgi:hypothetical protein
MANPEVFPLKILQIFAPFFPQKHFVQLAEELILDAKICHFKNTGFNNPL